MDEVHPMGNYSKKQLQLYWWNFFQLKWSKVAIVVVLTCGHHFQLQFWAQLVLVDSCGQQ
jgi:hypothetical protein